MPRKPVVLRLTASTAWYAEGSRKSRPLQTAQRLSGVMTVLQTAQAALRDGQPDNVSRGDMALTLAPCALKLTSDEFEAAAKWVKSTVPP